MKSATNTCCRLGKFIITAIATLVVGLSASANANDLELTYEKFTLDNGLRVIVHEDRKAPIVAVNIWYGVGSRDEPEGRTGFAHLFEHLMYNGSENYDGEFFKPLEQVGATSVNGNTWFDRTVYYETVPTPALELALWMESDRMGNLLGAVTQEKLDEQRGVVQNEKRQGDNQPYGRVGYRILEGLFPAGHPYRHSTIGSMEDLNAASLEDVHQWFNTYYGAANTVLVLAGDINADEARPLVEKYFGETPSGPPLTVWDSFVPDRRKNTSETMYDKVPQERLTRQWAVPGRLDKDRAMLELAAAVLGGGKNSRLFGSLVYDKQIATSAYSYVNVQQLASMFAVTVDARDGVAIDGVEQEVNTIIDRLISEGPTPAELNRIKTDYRASLIRGIESVSGDDGIAGILGQGELYADDPLFITNTFLPWIEAATPADVQAAAKKWLSDGYHQVIVKPYPAYSSTDISPDRASLPFPTSTPDLSFPEVETDVLSNGVKLYVANRPTVPVVNIATVFDAGYAADQGGKLGVSSYTLAMLDEGTQRRSALAIAEEAENLGAIIGTSSTLDTSSVSLSALKSNLRASLALYADVIMNPAFDQKEIDRLRKQWLAGIAQEQAQPVQLALRLLPPALYGSSHAYGIPYTGSGTADSIQSITRDDLLAFHATWLQPSNASIVVVGDTTLAEIKPELERALRRWASTTDVPEKAIANVANATNNRLILIDKPGSPQSIIMGGRLAPSSSAPNDPAITAMNDILGGQFTSRINMNLREDKSWAYGAFTFLVGAKGQRPVIAYAPVQTDKTAEALTEMRNEIGRFLTSAPATGEELSDVVALNVKSLPGNYETGGAVMSSMLSSLRYGRPLDYPATLKQQFESLALSDIEAAARQVFQPATFTWIVVGDLDEIEQPLRSLGLESVEIWDLDGNKLR
ncbi:pitrilysin family protein [Hyphococcus flavus]|uniref:Pitrilysin family protein n=1 Tax=Hyphococcus flavus TaxID=1866326 RepID=A0AAE9ZGR6_9PROT|nr:pitrilysin family protein [Hyphococcus flavus]WDI32718.1 pitrilysin family protein [Hyphococcus flavus]